MIELTLQHLLEYLKTNLITELSSIAFVFIEQQQVASHKYLAVSKFSAYIWLDNPELSNITVSDSFTSAKKSVKCKLNKKVHLLPDNSK